MASVSAIIPAYNEADVIADTIQAVSRIPGVSQIVVADDGSSDSTVSIAMAVNAGPVVMLGRNRGKGAALNKALSQANGEVLLLLDADLGKSASEAVNLLEPVLSGEADMTIAVFKPTDADGKLSSRSGGFGLAMKTARLGIRLLGGKWVQSPLSGQRAFKREIVEKRGFALRFGVETGLTIDALRGGYRVVEVPVRMVHRPSGRSLRGFVHRGRQMADVLLTLGRKALGR